MIFYTEGRIENYFAENKEMLMPYFFSILKCFMKNQSFLEECFVCYKKCKYIFNPDCHFYFKYLIINLIKLIS